MVKLLDQFLPGTREMRSVYCEELMRLAEENRDIVAINCDLTSSMGMKPFAQRFPERAFNVGIAEANGCSMAGGMSVGGLIPFFHTFAVFASRRVCDQVFMSCAYPGLNVKIIGGDVGISATYNGGTHMSFEDMAVLSAIPGLCILEPSDPVMLRCLVRQMAGSYGVQYLRMPRKQVVSLYDESSSFEIGKAALIREGSDLTIIAAGFLVYQALLAAEQLEEKGISARVVDMFTIKPVDAQCIAESARKTGAIVTVENHQIRGGLGSAVSDIVVQNCPVPMEFVGVHDEFGEVGQQDYLMRRFGMDADSIVKACEKVLRRKKEEEN